MALDSRPRTVAWGLYRNWSSQLETNNKEVTFKRQISWDQCRELTSGRASLTVQSNDGQFLDA